MVLLYECICVACVCVYVWLSFEIEGWGLMAWVAALINWTLINFSWLYTNDLKIVLSHHFQLFLIFQPISLTFFPLLSSSTKLPSHICTPLPPSLPFICLPLVSFLGDYVPSLPLFNLIKENAIQLSFSWPIASFLPPHHIVIHWHYMAANQAHSPCYFQGWMWWYLR